MKRLFWLGVGVAVGAVVVRVVTKKARGFTPRGIAAAARDSGQNLVDSVRDFVDDVRDGMHERELELRAGFVEGVDEYEDLPDELADELAEGDHHEIFGQPAGGRVRDLPTAKPPEDTIR
jgi:hypothetical protein